MKTRFTKFLAVATVLLAAVACKSDLKDLEKRVDDLDSRVTALEALVATLNSNVETYAELLNATTIKSVSESNGVYTITLNNGTVLTLDQGSVGVGNVPVMYVDDEGYWMVDYQDGNGKVYVYNNNEKVKATGNDGVTPQFAIDSDGYWTVSYDGGSTYSKVLDANGNAVSALPSDGSVNDSYFNDVSYTDDVFTLTLKDGTVLTIPVLSDFLCSIEGADGTQTFNFSETKTYTVTMTGVESTVLTCPQGWSASLTDATLSVTAPSSVVTKATLADSETDVCILAISASGYATVAKLQVALSGESGEEETKTPVATLTAGDVTESSLSFSVSLTDADSYKYYVSTSAGLSADEVEANGTSSTEASVTVSDLAASTTYTVYVLPYNGTTAGTLVSTTMTTSEAQVNDYYQAYVDGKDITIAGVTYNKATNGDATLITAEAADTDIQPTLNNATGVFFLDAGNYNFIAAKIISVSAGKIVLIGRYPDNAPSVQIQKNIKLMAGGFVAKNINFDMSAIDGSTNAQYFMNNANSTETAAVLHYDDCTFSNVQKPILYMSLAGNGITSLKFMNSKVLLSSGIAKGFQLLNLYKSTCLDVYKEIVFDNNVVACASGTEYVTSIINYDVATTQSGTTWEGTMSVCNNIFYNVPSKNCAFRFYQLASFNFDKNVYWADSSLEVAHYVHYFVSTSQSADVVTIGENLAYGLAKPWTINGPKSTVTSSPAYITKLEADPFASADASTGSFTLNSDYSAYGPQE